MSRSIVDRAAPRAASEGMRGVPDGEFTAPTADEVDTYADKLLKLIPAEVIGVYLAMTSILDGATSVHAPVPWLVFLFGVFATWFYLRFTLKVTETRQLLLTSFAFVVWAFTIGGPFESLDWYRDAGGTYAGLLLAAYTFMAPQIRITKKAGTAPAG